MVRRLLFLFAILAFVLVPRSARAVGNPHLAWSTIETEHFRIDYYSGEEEIAHHLAELAEAVYGRLVPAVGWPPGEKKTEIVLTDDTDTANGSATALPYDAIHLYVTAPDDLSPLGDVDDWYQELITHEYTHILHTDHIGGIPALVNKVVGKTLAPNQVNPRWLLEGLAVFEESARTSGGRLRSSMWNMFMRADMLENNVAPIDVFSNTPRRWPQGNIWYLYGSFFMRWIADTYGEQAVRAMIDDYGSQLVPYGINRSIRRATGRTYEELYPAFVQSMQRTYGEEAAAVRARGLREGVRLTSLGQTDQKVRWIPGNAWGKEHEGELLWYLDDAHTRTGLYRLPLVRDARGVVVGARQGDRELMIRTSGVSTPSFAPNGDVYFDSVDVHDDLYAYYDLFRLAAGLTSPSGLDGDRDRLTDGFRAISPDVSPDGRRIVFTTNHRGTSYLQLADLVAPHGIANVRALVPSAQFDQAYAPRWSPDNRHIAYSVWRKGGFRDIRYVDTQDGSYVDVTHDRAIDSGPAFSHDGKYLFFHSDRTGISNIYAWEIATGRFFQVSNVVNGAFQPEPSPDGKTIAYVGYTAAGFDLYAMPLDPSTWLTPEPYVEHRPSAPPPPPPVPMERSTYNPLPSLMPRKYTVQITPGNFGEASIVSATGSDIAGIHSFVATISTEFEEPTFQGDLQYTYGRLPFDVNIHLFRSIAPRNDYQLGQNYHPIWVEEDVGAETGIAYSLPRAFDTQSFGLTYSVTRVAGNLPAPANKLDPYETPVIPARGMVAALHFGWSYSNAEGYLWGVGPEKGISVGATLDWSDDILGSEFSGYAVTGNVVAYYLMPWLRHHSLALHAGAGTGGGNLGTHGLFYVGGFVDFPVISILQNQLIQEGIVLRGYPVVAEEGTSYGLFNAEYRFPIANIDRGPSTLPVFLNRINGAAFMDYGAAFSDPTQAHFKTGVGGELWFDIELGYVIDMTLRVGYAKGLASGGIDKEYFVAAVPF